MYNLPPVEDLWYVLDPPHPVAVAKRLGRPSIIIIILHIIKNQFYWLKDNHMT